MQIVHEGEYNLTLRNSNSINAGIVSIFFGAFVVQKFLGGRDADLFSGFFGLCWIVNGITCFAETGITFDLRNKEALRWMKFFVTIRLRVHDLNRFNAVQIYGRLSEGPVSYSVELLGDTDLSIPLGDELDPYSAQKMAGEIARFLKLELTDGPIEPRRKWQIHLSTAMILMLAASLVLFGFIEYGMYLKRSDPAMYASQFPFIVMHCVFIAIYFFPALANVCERWIRNRGRIRKSKGPVA